MEISKQSKAKESKLLGKFDLSHHGDEIILERAEGDQWVAWVKKQTGIDEFRAHRLQTPSQASLIALIAVILGKM